MARRLWVWALLGVWTSVLAGAWALVRTAGDEPTPREREQEEAAEVNARLKGGPFDGDTGALAPGEHPDELYCLRCEDPRCHMAGVHWWKDERVAAQDASMRDERIYRYRLVGEDFYGLVYVYGELSGDGHELLTRELVPATA